MRKIAFALLILILILLIVRSGLSYWYFDRGVHSFDTLTIATPVLSGETAITKLRTIKKDFEMSHTIKPTSAAYKNQEYIAQLLRDLKTKNNDFQKSPQKEDTSSGAETPLSGDKSEMSGSEFNSSDS